MSRPEQFLVGLVVALLVGGFFLGYFFGQVQ